MPNADVIMNRPAAAIPQSEAKHHEQPPTPMDHPTPSSSASGSPAAENRKPWRNNKTKTRMRYAAETCCPPTRVDDEFGSDGVDWPVPPLTDGKERAAMLRTTCGFAGAVAYGAKRGRMLVAPLEASEFYDWSTHGGFSKAACYAAVDGPGHVRIVTDLVGAPPRPLLHFCAGEAQVCPASQKHTARLRLMGKSRRLFVGVSLMKKNTGREFVQEDVTLPLITTQNPHRLRKQARIRPTCSQTETSSRAALDVSIALKY